MALDPRLITVWSHLLGALQEQGRYRLCHRVAEGAADLMPQEPMLHAHLGIAKADLGDFDGSLACCQRALELDSELDGKGKGKPVTLWRANSLAQVGRYGEALDLLAQPQPAYSTRHEFIRALRQADTLLWLDRWDEGRAALQRLLTESRPPTWTSRDLGVIGSLILRTQNPQVWRRFIALWLDLFGRHQRLNELGESLVRSLRYCAIDWVTDQTAQAWFATWRDLAGATAELALPLRLLGAGVSYRAGRDPRALLDLPREERGLLEPWLINLLQDTPDQTDRDLDDLLQRVASRLAQEARQAQARAYWQAPAPPPGGIDLDTVLADFGARPASGPARLLPGPWDTLDRDRAAALLRLLADRCEDGARALARPGLRVLAVARCRPSFSDRDLYQVDLLEGPRPGALDLLAGTEEVRVLDGLSQTLFDLVVAGTLRLDTPERQSDYTRFFCSVVRAEEGRFQVIDAIGELRFRSGATPPEALTIPPWSAQDSNDDQQPTFGGPVLYDRGLFQATLRLEPQTGRVAMPKDEPIATDLPIVAESFDGPLRFLDMAANSIVK